MVTFPDNVPTLDEIMDRVIFKDQLLIVLNKPTNIPVHAGPNGGHSLESYFPHMTFGYKEIPQLAHRLDRDTSGCLVLGRNARAMKKMGSLFQNAQIGKTYWAITEKTPNKPEGMIDASLLKTKKHKGWTMECVPIGTAGAKASRTQYKVLKAFDDGSAWVELYPKTGRTHQLRVHLDSIGCPIKGDWLYGPNKDRPKEGMFPTLHLHAREIVIPLYHDQAPLVITADPPKHIAHIINSK